MKRMNRLGEIRIQDQVLRLAPVLILVGALCLVAIGLVGGGLGILVGIVKPNGDLLATMTFSISFLALTVGLGLVVAWHAWQAIQGRQSGPFQPRRAWSLGLAFVLALVIGQLALTFDLLPVVIFPFFHVAAAVLPSFIVLALVGYGLGGVGRWRDVALQTSSGALFSTFLAFTLEFAFLFGLLAAVFSVVTAQPGGLELLQALAQRLQDPAWLQTPSGLLILTHSPVVLAAAFLIVSAVVPLVEEGVKTVGVVLLVHRRPGLSEAFLWGVASGAGFALVEGLFSGAGALESWAPVTLLRVGATLMHCFTGGLMGLAWYYLFVQGRWGRLLGLYATSVSLHGLWNALAVGMAFLSLATLDQSAAGASQTLAGTGTFAILALLVILFLAAGLGLLGLTLYIRKRFPARSPAGGTESLSP
jgi:hypothetical protein